MTDMFWVRVEENRLPKKLLRAVKILKDKELRHEIRYAKSVVGFDWKLDILWWGGMGWYNVASAYFADDGMVEAERRVNPFAENSSWCMTNYSTFMRMYVHDNKGKDQ